MLLTELLLVMAGHPSSLFPVVYLAADTREEEQKEEHGELEESSSAAEDANIQQGWKWSMQFSRKAVGMHPGEQGVLDALARLAAKHRRVQLFATKLQDDIRHQVLHAGRAGTSKREYLSYESAPQQCSLMAPLAAHLLAILQHYQQAVLDTEADTLRKSWDMVTLQDEDDRSKGGSSQQRQVPFVSLANVRSRFHEWEAPLTSLDNLVTTLLRGPRATHIAAEKDETLKGTEITAMLPPHAPACPVWQPRELFDLLSVLTRTGVTTVKAYMQSLLEVIEDAWRPSLIAWLCEGESFVDNAIPSAIRATPVARWTPDDEELASTSSLQNPRTGSWALNPDALPTRNLQDEELVEALLYTGQAVSRIKSNAGRPHKNLQKGMSSPISAFSHDFTKQRKDMLLTDSGRPCSQPLAFRNAVMGMKRDIAEWMWSHLLTSDVIMDVFTTLGDIFLHRDGLFTTAFLERITRLRRSKLLTAHSASAGALRTSDVELALRDACSDVGHDDAEWLEHVAIAPISQQHQSLTGEEWKLTREKSPVPAVQFSTLAVNIGFEARFVATFPIDFVLSPSELQAYTDIYSYLLAIHMAQQRLRDCWSSISKSQRVRRKFTGTREGGSSKDEERARRNLFRLSCGFAQSATWFLEVLTGHLQLDVIDAQYTSFLEGLRLSTGSLDTAIDLQKSSLAALHLSAGEESNATSADSPIAHVSGSASLGDSHRHASGIASTASESYSTSRERRAATDLDITALQATHKSFIAFVLDGLLLTDPVARRLIYKMLQATLHFTALIDSWGGDVLPELLSGQSVSLNGEAHEFDAVEKVLERRTVLIELHRALQDHMQEFFTHLTHARPRPSMLLPFSASIPHQSPATSLAPARHAAMNLAASRHQEQLLLRLDFNGVLSQRVLQRTA